MADVRVLGDAVPPIKARLAQEWNGDVLALDGPAARITDELPADWHIKSGQLVIVVTDDGGPVVWPAYAHPIIRVTAYANGKQTAKAARAASMGYMLNTPIPGVANLHSTGIGYTEARDEETGADLASFTVTAAVKTKIITV